MSAEVYRCGIFTTSGTNAAIYYDNVVAEAICREYAERAPIKVLGAKFNYSPITAAKDFEDGVINSGIVSEHKIDSESTSCVTASVVANPFVQNVGNAAGKVLFASIGKDAGSNNPLTNRIVPANLAKEKDSEGNFVEKHGTYVFSYDVRYDNLGTVGSDTVITDVIFNHGPDSNRSKSYWNFFSINLGADGKFKLKVNNNQKGTPNRDFVCTGLDLGDGKWHNLRFVVEKAGADSVTSVFLDDVCVINRLNCYYISDDTEANTYLVDILFRQRKMAFDYDVYYDNIHFEYAGDYDFISDVVK
jgi:hypothetical protein